MKKTIAMIGLGYWGKNLLRNLHELGVLHTACDVNADIISQRKKVFPDINYTTSLEEIIKNPDIKAVVIAAPALYHYELVKKFLLADKDVFVEKPLALTVKDGSELVALAEKKNRILMVGHILQYHSAVIKLKELISKGELGRIQYIYSNRLNIGKLRTEENILWSFAPHDISVILMLLEEEPVRVKAFGEDYLTKDIYDTTLTTLEFKNGVKAHIFVSWLHPFKEQKLVVVGSKQMAVFDDVSSDKLLLYPHKIEWQDGKIPVVQKADYEIVPLGDSEPLKSELQHYVECVSKRKSPLTDGHEGLNVLKILELAEQDLFKNKLSTQKEGEKPFYIHETSCIDDGVKIGGGTKIWHYSHILKNSIIGINCTIGQNVSVGPDVSVGDGCKIQNNVSLYKGVTLEEGVFCGPSCVFTNVYNPRAFIERKNEFLITHVKKGVTIGANATIICGVTLGKYSVIGAGAVVRTDIPDYAIVVGVPAKQIGWACKCGTTLKFDHAYKELKNEEQALCGYCNNEYRLKQNQLDVIKEN